MIQLAQPELDFASAPDPAEALLGGLPSDVLRIIGYLSAHCRGADRAASAEQIGRWIGLDIKYAGRKVRQLIGMYMHRLPFMVTSAPGRGFFITDDPADLTHWERTQWATVGEIFTHIKQHRRLARRCGFVRTGAGRRVEYHRKA